MFEQLYDLTEQSQVNFVGYISEMTRYDFAIIYTEHFFGKSLVVCMQSGKSALLCNNDIHDLEYLQRVFNVDTQEQTVELSLFLQQWVPPVPSQEQYS